MLNFSAYILTFFIFLQISTNLLISVYYVSNKATITHKYCENKNKPKLKCEGKCYLKKIIQKVKSSPQEKNSNSCINITEIKKLTLFIQHFKFYSSFIKSPSVGNMKVLSIFMYEQNYNYQPSFFIFHPPQLSLS